LYERTKRMHSDGDAPPAVGMTRELINHPKCSIRRTRRDKRTIRAGWFHDRDGKPSDPAVLAITIMKTSAGHISTDRTGTTSGVYQDV